MIKTFKEYFNISLRELINLMVFFFYVFFEIFAFLLLNMKKKFKAGKTLQETKI